MPVLWIQVSGENGLVPRALFRDSVNFLLLEHANCYETAIAAIQFGESVNSFLWRTGTEDFYTSDAVNVG